MPSGEMSITIGHSNKMRGVCWVGGDSVVAHNFDDLSFNHIDWISQTPFGWQPHHDQPELRTVGDRGYWGERDAGILETTRLAKKQRIRTILKPHIWLHTRSGKWRADIEMRSKEEWEQWFCNYTDFIMHYADVAEQASIEVLCIGTELYHPAVKFPDRWRQIVSMIREVYSGKLTYAANFDREFQEIIWWDALDYIGIQAYFPLSSSTPPTIKELRNGWKPHVKKIESVAAAYDMQVVFTELGYRNDVRAAKEPWLWPHVIENQLDEHSDEVQALCYKAFFEECWSQTWLAGTFFWKWHHSSWKHRSYNEMLQARRYRLDSLVASGKRSPEAKLRPIGFTPQNKPAQEVMKKYFSRK